jgi:hypothetical protein
MLLILGFLLESVRLATGLLAGLAHGNAGGVAPLIARALAQHDAGGKSVGLLATDSFVVPAARVRSAQKQDALIWIAEQVILHCMSFFTRAVRPLRGMARWRQRRCSAAAPARLAGAARPALCSTTAANTMCRCAKAASGNSETTYRWPLRATTAS